MPKLNSLFPDDLKPEKQAPAPAAGGKSAGAGTRGKTPAEGALDEIRARTFIKDLVPGQEVEGIYLVQEASLRAAKNGSKYVQASFGDRSGLIPVRHWDASEKDFTAYRPSGYIKVRGRMETYQGRPQMIVFAVQAADPGQVNASDFLPVSTRDPEEMTREFEALLAGIQDPDYRRLLESIFAAPGLREAYYKGPAASVIHHAWIGGLLEHVLSACRTAQAVASERPYLNRDLLLTGVILHDIGKIEEIDAGPGFGYTDRGRLCGHIALGALLIDRHAQQLKDFPPKKRDLILHLILSHHGEQAHGSPVTPCTPEAVALHYIECMDAKLQGVQSIIERERAAGNPGNWSDFARVVDGRIYRG